MKVRVKTGAPTWNSILASMMTPIQNWQASRMNLRTLDRGSKKTVVTNSSSRTTPGDEACQEENRIHAAKIRRVK